MSEGRILALDPGTARIGLAISDDMGWRAKPLEVRKVKGRAADLDYLVRKVEELRVVEVVVGVPYTLDGGKSISTEKALAFAAELRARLSVPVTERDEALTTWAADEKLKSKGVLPMDRRKTIDAEAAAVLLQEVLDERDGAG